MSKPGPEVKEALRSASELNVLVTSLLAGSTFSLIGTGGAVADESPLLGNCVELIGLTTTLSCISATLINIFLERALAGIGDANMHAWCWVNDSFVAAASLITAISCYLFMTSLLLLGIVYSTTPLVVIAVWTTVVGITVYYITFVGSAAAFAATHSGMLADVPVIPDETLLQLRDAAAATQLICDRALASDGDHEAMLQVYKALFALRADAKA